MQNEECILEINHVKRNPKSVSLIYGPRTYFWNLGDF